MSDDDPKAPGRDAPPPDEPIPLGQRLLDRPFLLLAAGMAIMFVFFTGWGLWEVFTLPQAPLP